MAWLGQRLPAGDSRQWPLLFAVVVLTLGLAQLWTLAPWVALLASWSGAILAGCVAFAFARYVGRQWVQERGGGLLVLGGDQDQLTPDLLTAVATTS